MLRRFITFCDVFCFGYHFHSDGCLGCSELWLYVRAQLGIWSKAFFLNKRPEWGLFKWSL